MANYIALVRLILMITIIVGAVALVSYFTESGCRKAGGVPVGHYKTDCWDNVNKTFIE